MRKLSFAIDEYYHLYNRGVEKRKIFLNDYESRRFVILLYLCNSRNALDMRELQNEGRTFGDYFLVDRGVPLVDIGAYCLMPNHFHLLVKEIVEGGITEFMRKVGTAYSTFFNKAHERTGSLFQGRFKAQHASTDRYLKYLFSYIHLNPVKLFDPQWKENGISNRVGAKEYLQNYEFSSLFDYQGKLRPQLQLLNKDSFPGYFLSRSDFDSHIEDFLSFRDS